MVGRAGRTGLGEAGDSIVIAQQQDLPKIKELLLSPMNQALSGMHVADGKGLRYKTIEKLTKIIYLNCLYHVFLFLADICY